MSAPKLRRRKGIAEVNIVMKHLLEETEEGMGEMVGEKEENFLRK